MSRPRTHPLVLIGFAVAWLLFAAAVAWPTIALIADSAETVPSEGWEITARQWTLLGKTVLWVGIATVVSILISLPAAVLLARNQSDGERRRCFDWRVLLALPLFVAPMVCAFGWTRILPTSFPPVVQCIGVWALWAWPVPAFILAIGWRRVGRAAYEAALLEAGPGVVFPRIALPVLGRYIVAAGLIVATLLLGEYTVPHSCSLTVYATELLGWAEGSPLAIDTAWRAMPMTVLILLGLAATALTCRPLLSEEPGAGLVRVVGGRRRAAATVGTILLLLLSLGAPLLGLALRLSGTAALGEAVQVYGKDALISLVVAGAAGFVSAALALPVCLSGWWSRPAIAWALVLGVVPGALVGRALVAAYLRVPVVYDHWPIVTLAMIARYGWIPLLVVSVSVRSVSPVVLEAAAVDGAHRPTLLRRIHLPLHVGPMVFAGILVTALSLGDLATTSLVRVPEVNLVAHVIVEKFHRFEDDMLVSLSLVPVIVGVLAALVRGAMNSE